MSTSATGPSRWLTAIAAPFVLGYAKKDPLAALLHVGLGLGTLVTSLLTDYRADKGVAWPMRSRGGPRVGPAGEKHGIRVGGAANGDELSL